jgi:hypothetical protein
MGKFKAIYNEQSKLINAVGSYDQLIQEVAKKFGLVSSQVRVQLRDPTEDQNDIDDDEEFQEVVEDFEEWKKEYPSYKPTFVVRLNKTAS